MTGPEVVEKIIASIDAGESPLQAFAALTKGDDGVKGLKRQEFEEEYLQLCDSKFLRKLKLRTAREDEFKKLMYQTVLKCDPPEAKVMEINGLMMAALKNPSAVPALLGLVKEFGDVTELEALYLKLWPKDAE